MRGRAEDSEARERELTEQLQSPPDAEQRVLREADARKSCASGGSRYGAAKPMERPIPVCSRCTRVARCTLAQLVRKVDGRVTRRRESGGRAGRGGEKQAAYTQGEPALIRATGSLITRGAPQLMKALFWIVVDERMSVRVRMSEYRAGTQVDMRRKAAL